MEDIKSDMLKAIEEEQWDKLRGILEQERGALEEEVTDILQTAFTHNAPDDIITRLVSSISTNKHNEGDDTALHLVLRHGRWQLVPVLLQKGADVNVCGKDEETPLHTAVRESAPLDIIMKLISHDNINMLERSGSTCLDLSICKSNWELVPILILHGVSIEMGSGYLLDMALRHEAPADVLLQLVNGNINVKDNTDGNTPLHKVLLKEQWETALTLLQAGADINICNLDNQTPLHVAVRKYMFVDYDDESLKDIIPQLISPENINTKEYGHTTAIHNALREEEWELVSLFIQKGADISDSSLIVRALEKGATTDIIKQLIYPHNINKQNMFCGTPLSMAVKFNRWDLVPVFLQHGADVNVDELNTLLHEAIRQDAPVETITQLISPQNINTANADEGSPLQLAIRHEKLQLVPVLIQHGAAPLPWHTPLSEAQPTLSLKSLCITTIRSCMPIKSTEAFEGLGLPSALLPDLKLEPLADGIVAAEQRRIIDEIEFEQSYLLHEHEFGFDYDDYDGYHDDEYDATREEYNDDDDFDSYYEYD